MGTYHFFYHFEKSLYEIKFEFPTLMEKVLRDTKSIAKILIGCEIIF